MKRATTQVELDTVS